MIVKINGESIAPIQEEPFRLFGGIRDGIGELNDKIDTFFYWINPANWLTEGYQLLLDILQSPTTAIFIMCGTIVCIIFTMLGAESPKKVAFWTWVFYFGLKMILL